MRVPHPRAYLCAAILVAAPLACTNNRNTNVKIADGEAADSAGEAARTPDAPGRPMPRRDLLVCSFSSGIVAGKVMHEPGVFRAIYSKLPTDREW